MSAKRLGKLINLNKIEGLERALERTSELARLTSALGNALPDELGAQLVSASVDDDGVLLVKTASSAWAARLRFEEARLLRAAEAAGAPASKLVVRVSRPSGDQA